MLPMLIGARAPSRLAAGLRLPVMRRLGAALTERPAVVPPAAVDAMFPAWGLEMLRTARAAAEQRSLDDPEFTHSTRHSRLTSEPGSDVAMASAETVSA